MSVVDVSLSDAAPVSAYEIAVPNAMPTGNGAEMPAPVTITEGTGIVTSGVVTPTVVAPVEAL